MKSDPPDIQPHPPTRLPLSGFFEDPLWFRCLVAPLVLIPGCVILGFCFKLVKEGGLLVELITFLTVEPLGTYLVLTGLALIAPAAFGKWYLASRRRAFMLIGLWAAGIGVVLLALAIFANA